MKKFLLSAAAAAALLASTAAANAEAVTIQLKWVTQAQFAGYLVAQSKGFYKEAGLDVTIKPGGPDINPQQVLAGGGADVVVDWMPSALATREKGLAVVNIAQPFKRKKLGVWFGGNEYPFLSWMSTLGLGTAGGADGVEVIKQGFNVDPLIQKQADCVSTMTYNEYWQVIDAGISADQLITFKYEDQGVATLEDGLYVMEDKLKDPAFVDTMAKFVKASMKGWDYARANNDEAAQIVVDGDATGVANIDHQKRMMGEVSKLTEGSDGSLDVAAAERTVATLMKGGSDPVITKAPTGAWTDVVMKAAMQ
jgi:NitT/TauT family transport system substrate-binding protein